MPVRFSDPSDLVSPKAVARLLQILLTCAALGLSKTAGGGGAAQAGGFATFAVVAWCFSFTSALLVFVVEFTQVHSLFPLTWKNLSVGLAAFAGLMNLAASVTYPLLVVVVVVAPGAGDEPPPLCAQPGAWLRPPCAYHVAATVCSSLASVAYAAEVLMSRGSRRSTYLASGPGLLKVLQVSVACVLAVPLATGAIPNFPGFWWTVAALCACALLSLVAVVTVMECRACCPVPLERLLAAAGALGALLCGAVLVAWTLGLSRQGEPTAASGAAAACRWKLCLMSIVLISVDFLAYVADLVYSVKLSCSRN